MEIVGIRQSNLVVRNLGQCSYRDAWALQRECVEALIKGEGPELLIVCEHEPVITVGKSGSEASIIAKPEELSSRNIEVLSVERGGDVTYHGPGQLVVYPILDLRIRHQDVHWYMRSLEEVIILALQEFEIIGRRIQGRTGVWTAQRESDKAEKPKKIGSLGVRISRWCTYHGISLNVQDCSSGFALIKPCGFGDIDVTSIDQELGCRVSLEAVASVVVKKFVLVFESV